MIWNWADRVILDYNTWWLILQFISVDWCVHFKRTGWITPTGCWTHEEIPGTFLWSCCSWSTTTRCPTWRIFLFKMMHLQRIWGNTSRWVWRWTRGINYIANDKRLIKSVCGYSHFMMRCRVWGDRGSNNKSIMKGELTIVAFYMNFFYY